MLKICIINSLHISFLKERYNYNQSSPPIIFFKLYESLLISLQGDTNTPSVKYQHLSNIQREPEQCLQPSKGYKTVSLSFKVWFIYFTYYTITLYIIKKAFLAKITE